MTKAKPKARRKPKKPMKVIVDPRVWEDASNKDMADELKKLIKAFEKAADMAGDGGPEAFNDAMRKLGYDPQPVDSSDLSPDERREIADRIRSTPKVH